jgi:hypothetical protein
LRYVFLGAFEGLAAAAGCAAVVIAAVGADSLGNGTVDTVDTGSTTTGAAGFERLSGAAAAMARRGQTLRAKTIARERASGRASQTALATKRSAKTYGSFLRRGFGAILRSASRNSGDSVMASVGIAESES